MDVSIFEKDYISNFKPKESPDLFVQEFMSKKFLILLSNEKTCEDINNNIKFYNYIKVGTFLTSLLPLIFTKRFPIIRNLEKSWKRFFFKLGYFLIPNYSVVFFSEIMSYKNILKNFEDYGEKWINYKITGDLLDFNPDTKLIN